MINKVRTGFKHWVAETPVGAYVIFLSRWSNAPDPER